MNVHLHMIALDGVYANDREAPRFRDWPAPSSAEMQRLMDVIVVRVLLPAARRSAHS